MRKNERTDALLTALASAALLGYSLYHQSADRNVNGWKTSPYLFPVLLSGLGFLLAAALWREGRRGSDRAAEGGGPRLPAAVLALSGGYCLLLPLLRFLPATALYLAALLYALGERDRRRLAALSVGAALAVYALFGLGLNVRLP